MVLPEILSSIAGGSITLAGFAAVFRAFGGAKDPDGQSRVRLNSVIEGGLLIAFVSYLPAWLGTMELPEEGVWRISCLVIFLWGVLRIGIPSTRILRSADPLPELFILVVCAGVIALIAAAVTALGYWPYEAFSGYLLAVLMLLTNVGLIFIAQFRVEQIGRDDA